MKDELVIAYNEFMKISVKGYDVEPMYRGLSILAKIINESDHDMSPEQEAKDE